jgi:glucose-6-phosphate isomerase
MQFKHVISRFNKILKMESKGKKGKEKLDNFIIHLKNIIYK